MGSAACRLVIAVALLVLSAVATSAQQSPPAQMSRAQCSAAHSAALQEAYQCFKSAEGKWLDDAFWLQRDKVLNDCARLLSETNQKIVEEGGGYNGPGVADKLREIQANCIQSAILDDNGVLFRGVLECLKTFDATHQSLRDSCAGSLGASGSGLLCAARSALKNACEGHYDFKVQNATTKANYSDCGILFPTRPECAKVTHRVSVPEIPRAPAGTKQIIPANAGCGHVLETAKACNESCAAHSDEAACRKTCDAVRSTMMAACLPPALAPGAASTRASRPATGATGVEPASPAKARSNLDAHNLGPNFATPAPSSSSQSTGVKSGGAKTSSGGTTTWSPSGVSQQQMQQPATSGGFSSGTPAARPK